QTISVPPNVPVTEVAPEQVTLAPGDIVCASTEKLPDGTLTTSRIFLFVPVAKRHHLLVRWSHWLNVPLLLGLILSGISIYWASPIYQHKPDPNTGNFDVAAAVGVWICAHVPGLHHSAS